MSLVFHSRGDVLVRTRDGRNVTVMEPIEVVTDTGARYRVPVGAMSDGASTPNEVWTALPPFGEYWAAAVIHDAAYRGTLERQLANGDWMPAWLTKDQCDTLFLDAMGALGVDQLKKETLYEGVHLAGWRAFKEDRA